MKDNKFRNASEMRQYLATLIARHEDGAISDEDYDRRHAAMKTMAKVHGDVIREKAVEVAARAAGIDPAVFPAFFDNGTKRLK